MRSDLLSVARDAEWSPLSIEIGGLISRVEGFHQAVDPNDEYAESWDEVVETVSALVDGQS